jgi:UPF0042 nucleotide-binding protein
VRFVIVTGLSGAGKSQVIKCMEDINFYCIDNIPPKLIPSFAEVCYQSKLDKVALVTDLRGGEMFNQIFKAMEKLKNSNYDFEILFLEAADQILVKRYKETRKKHPLQALNESVIDAIAKERALLSQIRSMADNIIDTSSLTSNQLKEQITSIYKDGNKYEGIVTNVVSFGFKHGIPLDADLVFDVRFLPNPFYIKELKQKSGIDIEVSDFVMNYDQSKEFLEKLNDMISFLIPYYVEEGKSQLVIAIGCTGGQHRSVTIAIKLYEYLKAKSHNVFIRHRDVNKSKNEELELKG